MDYSILKIVLLVHCLAIKSSYTEFCDSAICEAFQKLREDLSFQKHTVAAQVSFGEAAKLKLEDLDRRLRTVEQPCWMIDSSERRWLECSHGPCRCRPETGELSCWQMELTHLPLSQAVPRDILKIDLSQNYLTSIPKEAFHKMVHLIDLNLANNRIDYLSVALVNMLGNLQHLSFNRNNVVEVPPTFFLRQINLLTVDFASNKIERLPEDLFRACIKISTIRLADNQLSEIPKTLFHGLFLLEDLDLSSNKLEEIFEENFRGLASLKGLKLNENKLRKIPSSSFNDLKNLEILSLRRNRLHSISKGLLDNLTNVRSFDLSGNIIAQISGQEFLKMSSLRELHLGSNFLEEVPNGTFRESNRLQNLFLYSNNIKYIQDNAFVGLVNLTYLILNNNLLKNFGNKLFSNVPNLTKVHMDSNKLQYIPDDSFSFLKKLVFLKMAKNPWHCDCSILYFSRWLSANHDKMWDAEPICRGPGDLGGRLVRNRTFEELCVGQWLSLTRLSPRLPVSTGMLIRKGIFERKNTSLSSFKLLLMDPMRKDRLMPRRMMTGLVH